MRTVAPLSFFASTHLSPVPPSFLCCSSYSNTKSSFFTSNMASSISRGALCSPIAFTHTQGQIPAAPVFFRCLTSRNNPVELSLKGLVLGVCGMGAWAKINTQVRRNIINLQYVGLSLMEVTLRV